MSIARVTVGIPVYNGEAMLEECLSSLLAQSFSDFSIVLSDNASTDATQAIYQAFTTKDRRIDTFRHPKNLGPVANFRYAAELCDTEYFMWRADDDYSDEDYIAKLVDLLDANPQAQLAVPKVVTRHSESEYTPEALYEEIDGGDGASRFIERFYRYHPSWYYGLWRTQYLKETIARVWKAYPEAYAGDHLTLLSPILDDVIVGRNDTLFVQRTYSPVKGDGMRGERSLDDRIAMLERLMPLFYDCYEAEVRRRSFPPDQERRLLDERGRYTYNKLRASPRRILRLKVKRGFKRIFGKR